jgi:hypothetical protein
MIVEAVREVGKVQAGRCKTAVDIASGNEGSAPRDSRPRH